MSKILKTSFSLLSVIILMITSCSKDEVPNVFEVNLYDTVEINISGLENLGDGYVYEVWTIEDDSPESIGTFKVDDSNKNFKKEFTVKPNKLAKANSIMVSIEPVDSNPHPSNVIVLTSESLTGKVPSQLTIKENIGDFSMAEGYFTLLSPSDGNDTKNEKSGIWFVKGSKAGLTLPTLGSGWIYEAWIGCENAKKLSLGKFSSASSADQINKYCDNHVSFKYPFPGEDLLKNPPEGFSFPIDLVKESISVWITVEPNPDNSPEPFYISPLKAKLKDGKARSHSAIKMDHNAVTKIYGTVKKTVTNL